MDVLSQGHTHEEAARILHISRKTVSCHVLNLGKKLDSRTAVHTYRTLIERGFLLVVADKTGTRKTTIKRCPNFRLDVADLINDEVIEARCSKDELVNMIVELH